jgi:hypothetical protein
MANNFHINMRGEAGECRAEQGGCPFGGPEDHYASPEAARAAYESFHSEQTFAQPVRKEKPAVSSLSRQELETLRSETNPVARTIRSEKIKRGALVEGKKVTGVRLGNKYVYLTLHGESKERQFAGGVDVDIIDPLPTARAQAAKDRLLSLENAEWQRDNSAKRLQTALDEVTTSIATRGEASSSTIERLMTTQSERSIWQEVEATAKSNEMELGDAATAVAERYKEQFAQGYGYRSGLSRSSSVVSNVLEDAKTEAVREFVRGFGKKD